MRQFDVCLLNRGLVTLVVLLQHDTLEGLKSRIVAPLSNTRQSQLIDQTHIAVELDEHRYVIQLDRMASIATSSLGRVVGNVTNEEHRIKRGLDLVFFGV